MSVVIPKYLTIQRDVVTRWHFSVSLVLPLDVITSRFEPKYQSPDNDNIEYRKDLGVLMTELSIGSEPMMRM